ncbi:MAG: transcriptional repressor LexA [Nitrospirota bacterium]
MYGVILYTMPAPLTRRQSSILNFVERYTVTHRYPPTLREIAGHYGMRSINGVKKHLDALARKGHLIRKEGARALQIARTVSPREGVSVPILGRVAAGQPLLAEEHILGAVVLDRSVVRWNKTFLLKVKGDSMTGVGILNGDYVLVKAQSQAESGDIVVALLDDEATVKRLKRTATGYVLHPENPNYDPIPLTADSPSVRLLGKVKGVLRLPYLT